MTFDLNLIPQNLEAEQSVLGGLMLDNGSERSLSAMGMLKPDSFYSRAHQVIFSEMRQLVGEQKPIDLITLVESLEAKSLADTAGGFAYLAELSRNTPSSANIVHYAIVVREKAMERYGINKLTGAIELLHSRNGMTTAQKFDAIQMLITDVADHAKTGSRRGLRPLLDVTDSWTTELEQRMSGEKVRGLTTGIGSLDDLLGVKRLVRGSLLVVGARPKMGKTTLYSSMAINCATVENEPALMFSLEMPDEQILEKIIAQKARINPNVFYPDMKKSDFGYPGDWQGDFNKAQGVLAALINTNNLYIDDTAGPSLAHIVAEARRVKRQRGKVGMVLVDYLTLMTADKAERNDLAFGAITKGLKNLAKELDCVVVLLTQLNRNLEERANKRPLPSDSRDTGQIEQDCDYWVGIYREGAYDEHASQADTELLLRLNRHGDTGVVYCEQRYGVIHDCNQEDAEMKRQQSDAKKQKKGGF